MRKFAYMNSKLQHTADQLKTLGDPVRLRIMHALVRACCPVCVCELVDALKLQQYQVSRHLRALKKAGLVKTDKKGTWVYYDLVNSSEVSSITRCLEDLLQGEQCRHDIEHLRKRLALREDGECVVGFVSEEKLNRKMAECGIE